MAQALLNNLSIQPDLSTQTTSLKENIDTTADFQKVFENKAATNETNCTVENSSEPLTVDSSTDEENNTSILESLKSFCAEFLKQNNVSEETDADFIEDDLANNSDVTTALENANEETDDMNEEITNTPVYDNLLVSSFIGLNQTQLVNESKKDESVDLQEVQSSNVETEDISIEFNEVDLDNTLEGLVSNDSKTYKINSKEVDETTEKSIEEIVDEDMLKELNIESIESENGSTNDDSGLMQNQSPQEQAVKVMIQAEAPEFNEIKTNEVQTSAKPVTAQETTNPSKIIEQVTKQMEGMKSGSRVSLVLNPESLGKVEIQLINTKEGLSAQFTVATQDARNLLVKGLDGLKETLASHGVSIDNVSIKMNESQESEYNSDWTEQEGSNGGNKEQNSGREKRNKDEFEQTMSDIKEQNGNV